MAILYPCKIKMSNLGDILINVLLIRELSKHQNVYLDSVNIKLYNLSIEGNPFSNNITMIDDLSPIIKIPIIRWVFLLKNFRDINLVFDPPGAYGESKSKLKAILKAKKYYLRARILKIFNISIIRFGVSYSYLSNAALKNEIRISKYYKGIAIRDSLNYSRLKSNLMFNLYKSNDLSFLFDSNTFNSNSDTKIDKPYIIFSFRSAIEGNVKDIPYFNRLLECIHLIMESKFIENYDIYCTYQVIEDFQPTMEIYNLLKSNLKLNVYFIDQQLEFHDAIYYYENAEIIFSNRLHVSLWGLLCNTVSFILTDIDKHSKISGVFRDMKLSCLLLNSNLETIEEEFHSISNLSFLDVLSIFVTYKDNIKLNLQKEIYEIIYS